MSTEALNVSTVTGDGRKPYPHAQQHVPKILSRGWRVGGCDEQGFLAMNATLGLAVIITLAIERDGKPWKHISVSRRDKKIPDYLDMAEVRRQFVFAGEHAYAVWPCRDEYVNMAPVTGIEVLHLFVPLGHRPLPDFRIDRENNRL